MADIKIPEPKKSTEEEQEEVREEVQQQEVQEEEVQEEEVQQEVQEEEEQKEVRKEVQQQEERKEEREEEQEEEREEEKEEEQDEIQLVVYRSHSEQPIQSPPRPQLTERIDTLISPPPPPISCSPFMPTTKRPAALQNSFMSRLFRMGKQKMNTIEKQDTILELEEPQQKRPRLMLEASNILRKTRRRHLRLIHSIE